jgi:hypothetical protein
MVQKLARIEFGSKLHEGGIKGPFWKEMAKNDSSI